MNSFENFEMLHHVLGLARRRSESLGEGEEDPEGFGFRPTKGRALTLEELSVALELTEEEVKEGMRPHEDKLMHHVSPGETPEHPPIVRYGLREHMGDHPGAIAGLNF